MHIKVVFSDTHLLKVSSVYVVYFNLSFTNQHRCTYFFCGVNYIAVKDVNTEDSNVEILQVEFRFNQSLIN